MSSDEWWRGDARRREVREWISTAAVIVTIVVTGLALAVSISSFASAAASPQATITLANHRQSMQVTGQKHSISVTTTNYSGTGTTWVVVQSPGNGKFNTQSDPIPRTPSTTSVPVRIGRRNDHGRYLVYVILATPQHAADFGQKPLDTTAGGPLPGGVTFLASATIQRTK